MFKKVVFKPKTLAKYLLLIIFTIWCIFPILWMLNMSLKPQSEVLSMPPKFIFKPTLVNFKEVLNQGNFPRYFLNSLIIALFSTIISLLFGVPASYILAKFKFKIRSNIDYWVLSTRMIPPITILIPMFMMFRLLRLHDTYIAIILMHVAINLSLIIWIMKGFFMDVPDELQEAALIDGCSYWQSFLKIILPIVGNGIAAVGILAFLFSWNELLFALVLSSTKVRTAPVGIYNFISFQNVAWGSLCAAGILTLIPVLIFVAFAQKELVRGLTFGALKG